MHKKQEMMHSPSLLQEPQFQEKYPAKIHHGISEQCLAKHSRSMGGKLPFGGPVTPDSYGPQIKVDFLLFPQDLNIPKRYVKHVKLRAYFHLHNTYRAH